MANPDPNTLVNTQPPMPLTEGEVRQIFEVEYIGDRPLTADEIWTIIRKLGPINLPMKFGITQRGVVCRRHNETFDSPIAPSADAESLRRIANLIGIFVPAEVETLRAIALRLEALERTQP